MTGHPMLDGDLPSMGTLAGIIAATGATSVADSLQAATDVQVEPGPHRRRQGSGYRPGDVAVAVARASWHGPSGHRHRATVVQTVRTRRDEDSTVLVAQYVHVGDVGPAEEDALVLLALAGLLAPRWTTFEL